ncbi:unnamed protein product [Ixodes pacificus]
MHSFTLPSMSFGISNYPPQSTVDKHDCSIIATCKFNGAYGTPTLAELAHKCEANRPLHIHEQNCWKPGFCGTARDLRDRGTRDNRIMADGRRFVRSLLNGSILHDYQLYEPETTKPHRNDGSAQMLLQNHLGGKR